MQREILTWLSDIQRSIEEVGSFLPKSFSEFKTDTKTQRATERNIEIIGEAMNRILKLRPDFPIVRSRRIVDTRNRIIHGYETVSADVIWTIATNELPRLEAEIADILSARNDNH